VRRRTLIIHGPLAFRMRRLAAARAGAAGLQLMALPQLAARLAGGFTRPAALHELEPAIQQAMAAGDYAELEPMLALPGTPHALLTTLRKIWDADFDLQAHASQSSRLADLALIERRIHETLPLGAFTPRALRDQAKQRLQFAGTALGPIELEGHVEVPPVWRPFLDAVGHIADLTWRAPETSNHGWFRGKILEAEIPPAAEPEVLSCANPHAEAVEALRWMRELLASGNARPEEIAITAASPQAWDDHFLVLARTAGLPLHFSHGVPALSTRDGQVCAALADILLNGISQDRVRRLLGYATGQETMLKELPGDRAGGLPSEAGLFEVDHWRRALALAAASRPTEPDSSPILLPVIELLARGVAAAQRAGEGLLGPASRALWAEALRRAPAEALEYSIQKLRVPDGRDPGVSAVWCPASHLAGAPRRWVRVIGMTSGAWPRPRTEDPVLPDHLLARRILDPDPVSERDRRAFAVIIRAASGGCVLSRSRRDAQGKPLAPSPLLRRLGAARVLRHDRIPAHAFSEADRLAARPQEATVMPAVALATQCWTDWRRQVVTAHDGRFRPGHPMIRRTLDQIQSATSLRVLLRDPLGFVWQYTLGWRPTRQEQQPLALDARIYGELVHELLRRAVETLEPDPGYGRATPEEIENALAAAVVVAAAQWPLERSIPPQLLWQHTLEAARQLAFKALTLDEPFRPGTRSWTELKFGEPELTGAAELPWDPQQPVRIHGTNFLLRGSIDRLDLTTVRNAVRVSDYKTGSEPKNAGQIVFHRGTELQRVIYAAAVRQLLPDISHIVARLIFLGTDPQPHAHALADVDAAIGEIATHITAACGQLDWGIALPGPDAQETWNEFRLALPSGLASYLELKRQVFSQALAPASRIWSAK
jgi:PD-(D/E)XK nuclease superfamily protein